MLVSVVIPIYNVAPYIEQCLESVMRQSYRDLEVLLVDDCGTDDSIQIVRSMLGGMEDTTIDGIHYRILHHEHNRGLSAARNTGIDAATGEWVYFLDSDDWIDHNLIQALVISEDQAEASEMIVGQLETFDADGNLGVKLANGDVCPVLNLPDGVYSGNILQRYLRHEFYEMAWNKLVRREFLLRHKLYFKEGLIHEDTLWSFCCACLLQRIAVVNKPLYHYRIQSASIMAKSNGERRVKALNTILSSQIDFVNTHGLGANKLAFDYLFPRIKGYLYSPLYRENPQYAVDLYAKLEAIHFWSYRQLWEMVPARRDFFPYLCRLFPQSAGLWFYRKVVGLWSS